jgi:hypothetical protein
MQQVYYNPLSKQDKKAASSNLQKLKEPASWKNIKTFLKQDYD